MHKSHNPQQPWGRLGGRVLRGLNSLYFTAVRARNLLYRRGLLESFRSSARVISVGNLTFGGTGKTPLVAALLEYALSHGLKTAVLTRGYKSQGGSNSTSIVDGSYSGSWQAIGDEPAMLLQNIPQATLFVGKNRVASSLLAQKHFQHLILDDGFQHLRLQRDVNIALIDVERGLADLRPLPQGRLREPLSGLARADIVVYSKANFGDYAAVQRLTAPYLAPHAQTFCSELECRGFRRIETPQTKLLASAELPKASCTLISGIANPAAFEKLIDSLGLEIVDHLRFPDHHNYTQGDWHGIQNSTPARAQEHFFITTEKDRAKLLPFLQATSGPTPAPQLPSIFSCAIAPRLDPAFYAAVFAS